MILSNRKPTFVTTLARAMLGIVIGLMLTMATVLPGLAANACRIFHTQNGIFIQMSQDPGGDGTIMVDVNSVYTTYVPASKKFKFIYVTNDTGAKIHGYNSDGVTQCERNR